MAAVSEFKTFSFHLAEESAKIIKQYYRSDFNVEIKPDHSPVTIADKKSEEFMRNLIMKEYPDHGILGEEFGEYNSEAEYKWILDPIDGTKSFISGVPLFGTLIALMYKNQPILGVINHPILNECVIGDNIKTEMNGVKVLMRKCEDLSSATLLTSDHLMIARYRNKINFEKLANTVKLYRTWGDCYGYSLLASGYADIMIDPIMSKWDLAALIPVIKGSGGVITDYNGNNPLDGNSIVASNSKLHQLVISILNKE